MVSIDTVITAIKLLTEASNFY